MFGGDEGFGEAKLREGGLRAGGDELGIVLVNMFGVGRR